MSENKPILKKLYEEKIFPELLELVGKGKMAVPKILKISVNAGLGIAKEKSGVIEQASKDLSLICGQKAVPTIAKKSVAGFKLREGMKIGMMATIRGNRMYDFLARFLYIAVPRIRDFRGFSEKSIDEQGNFSFGLAEHSVFPEVNLNEKELSFPMQVTIVTSAHNKEKGKALLSKLGFPFIKE